MEIIGGETVEVQAAFLFRNLMEQVSDWFLFVILLVKIEIEYCAVASFEFAINIYTRIRMCEFLNFDNPRGNFFSHENDSVGEK